MNFVRMKEIETILKKKGVSPKILRMPTIMGILTRDRNPEILDNLEEIINIDYEGNVFVDLKNSLLKYKCGIDACLYYEEEHGKIEFKSTESGATCIHPIETAEDYTKENDEVKSEYNRMLSELTGTEQISGWGNKPKERWVSEIDKYGMEIKRSPEESLPFWYYDNVIEASEPNYYLFEPMERKPYSKSWSVDDSNFDIEYDSTHLDMEEMLILYPHLEEWYVQKGFLSENPEKRKKEIEKITKRFKSEHVETDLFPIGENYSEETAKSIRIKFCEDEITQMEKELEVEKRRQEEFKKIISRLGRIPFIRKKISDSMDFVKYILETEEKETISEELDEVFKKHFKIRTSLKKQRKAYELMTVEMPKISKHISSKIKKDKALHEER